MTQKNSDNRSLFVYTALIFLVAILVIVISNFATTHWEKLKVSEKDAENATLTNKVEQVSEENLQLVELNKTQRMKIEEKENEIVILTTERDRLSRQIAAYNTLIGAYDELAQNDKDGAREILDGISVDDLSAEQKEIYDKLVKETK